MRRGLVRSCVVSGALACALTGALAVAHCGTFTADDAASADGALADGAGADGGGEASMSDGAPRAEAGPFGGCITAVADDFERATIASPVWPAVQISGDASATLDTNDPYAGTTSLRIDLHAGSPAAYLEAPLGVRSRVRFAFALKLGGPVDRIMNVNALELADQQAAVFFGITNGVVQLIEQRFDSDGSAPSAGHTLDSAALLGWHRYAITLTLDASAPARAKVEIDDVVISEVDLPVAALRPGTVSVRCGVTFSGDGLATQLWLDDVAVCAEP